MAGIRTAVGYSLLVLATAAADVLRLVLIALAAHSRLLHSSSPPRSPRSWA